MKDMAGRVAIVTGGAGGIGGATACALAARGAQVVVTDVAVAAGRALAAGIGGTFLEQDVAREDRWDDVCRAAQALGDLAILVNAAGIEGDLTAGGVATSLAEWRRVMAINLDGTFLGCRAVMPHLLERGSGSIVNISSIVSCMGTPSGLAYGASKAGVEQLSRSMALIGARDGRRVRCNSVHPGFIRSAMTDRIVDTFAEAARVDRDTADRQVCAAIPFGVRGTVQDVAALIAFLASDAAAYVTGSAHRVDGAWSVISAG